MSASRRRRGLLAVWAVLGVLVAVIATLEIRDRRGTAGASMDTRLLLPVAVGDLGAVEIADRGRLHRFERDAGGAWFYHGVHAAAESAHTHAADAALSARIETALAALGRARIERRLAVDGDTAAYGLAAPDVVVVVYRRGQPQPLAQYAFGTLAPDTVSRYAQQVGRPEVVTIADYQVENLRSLVAAAGGEPR